MHRYERTALWTSTLASCSDDADEEARDRLRASFRLMRGRAATLAGEIARDLPDFTIHDVTHLDALWELADLIGGERLVLTPCEVFVLGGAILTHDLGMTAAAYPGGRAELREQVRWRDAVAQLMRRRGLPHQPAQAPPEGVAAEADREVLRLLHAEKAREIPTQRWTDARGHEIRFIADEGLREGFGRLIGELASSHWWPTTKLRAAFDKTIGAPTWCPSSWTVDPLRVACLLRVADAAHVDERRAPAFLHVLRAPSGIADHHWLFQRRMQQATRRGEQLVFSSTVAFAAEDAPAWWIAVETLRMIDGELRTIDALLQASGRERFAARRVAAVDDLGSLQDHIMVEGWRPVDTRVRISDVRALIERLGGLKLYGNDRDAPLRELIQNAADAVRARRVLESRPADWGRIRVARGSDDHGPWIEVGDDGLGMSDALLIGPLLDFGVSYWDSNLSCDEFPGLLASGFRSVGEFGIGFFSVFMWGPKVKVTTRSCRSADTLVLEFERGLTAPPLLRHAREDERLIDPGTIVRVWLAEVEDEPGYGRPSSLAGKCEWLCPTLDVDVYVQEGGAAQPKKVIAAGDWLTLEPEVLLRRIIGRGETNVEDALTGPTLADDDFELPRVLAMMEPIVDPDSGATVGRVCLRPPWLQDCGSVLVTRGLRLGWSPIPGPVLGALEGAPNKAARDEGLLSVRPELLLDWYERQEAKVASSFEGFARFEFASALVPAMAKPITKLPVIWGERGWTLPELGNHSSLPPAIILVFPGVFDDIKASMMRGSRRARALDDLPAQVFMLCNPLVVDFDHLDANNPTLLGLLGSIAVAWRVQFAELLKSSLLTCVVKGERHPAIPTEDVYGSCIHVLRRPDCPQESLQSALRGFYEFAGKHPGIRQAQSRMAAVGKVVGEVHAAKRALKRQQRGAGQDGESD